MREKKGNLIIALFIILPIATHLFLLNKYAIDLPFKDDYRVFVSYIHLFFTSPEKLNLIFLPDNESYPVLMRLITLFQYSLDGRLDFRHILLLCNLFLALFATSLSLHFFKKKEYWNIVFMCLLVFNTFHHEMYFRTDVGTYQLLSFSFSIFLFYGVSYYNNLTVFTRALFYIALVITPFGSINGMLAIAMVVTYLLINQENKKALIVTSLIFLLQILVIMNISGNGKSLSVFDNISKYNFELIYAYFLALGGIFTFRLDAYVWMITATLSAGIFFYTFYKLFFPFKFKLDFEKLIFLFSSASLALIVILRYNYWIEGYVSVLESRYKIYGALIVLLFCAQVGRQYKKIRPLLLLLLIGVFLVGFYKGTFMLKLQQKEQIAEAYNIYEDAYKEEYARPNYINKQKKEYLNAHSMYSFRKSKDALGKVFTEGNRLKNISDYNIKERRENPMANVDWGGINYIMHVFTINGSFPKHTYYFLKFNHKDKSSSVLFLQPPPNSVLNQLLGKQQEITELSSNFYPDALKESDFSDFEIYGVDNLGL